VPVNRGTDTPARRSRFGAGGEQEHGINTESVLFSCGYSIYMRVIVKETGRYLLRFDRGEEIVSGLAVFAAQERIPGASFTAIGAAEKVVISFYSGRTKKYEDMLIKDELEISALSGNVAWKGSEPIVHAHGVFSDRAMKTFGGHVKKCVISFTGEVSLSVFGKKVERAHDEKAGLNLLS